MHKLYLGFQSLPFIILTSGGTTQCMERIEPFSSLCSHFSSLFTGQAPSKQEAIPELSTKKTAITKEKNDFEQKLNTLKNKNFLNADTFIEETKQNIKFSLLSTMLSQDYDHCLFQHHLRPLLCVVNANSTNFLLYCYYRKYHDDFERGSMEELALHKKLLNACKNARIDGYSALGAAIIANGLSIKTKRDFIQQLMNHGFELTEKDKTLAAAEFCDNIPAEQRAKINSLLASGQGNLSLLPYDIRKFIAYTMMNTLKEEAFPLPDHA